MVIAALLLCMDIQAANDREVSYSYYRRADQRACPVLDLPLPHMSSLEALYAFPASSSNALWDDVAVIRTAAWIRLLYLETDFGSDLEILASWDSMIVQGYAGGNSGYSMVAACIPFRWSQRYIGSWGLQLEIEPGVYSTLKSLRGEDLNIPSGARIIKSFDPETAVYAGFKFFPGFEIPVVPNVGWRWARDKAFLVEFAYPESRLHYYPFSGLRLISSAGFMNWPEYNMSKDDRRKAVGFNEGSLKLGADWAITDYTELTLQCGYVFDRAITFKEHSADIEIDNAPFAGLGIRGRM